MTTSAHNWRNINNYTVNGGARKAADLNSKQQQQQTTSQTASQTALHDSVAVDNVAYPLASPKKPQTQSPPQIWKHCQSRKIRQGLIALQLYLAIERPTIWQLNACIDACARARPVRLRIKPFNYCNKHKVRNR
jgi:hypothetical protein